MLHKSDENTLSCGVRCARDFVLEPSATHAAAEKFFEREVQDICWSPRSRDGRLCTRVQALHECVVRGDVRRVAAAVAASRLRTLDRESRGCTLLYTLICGPFHLYRQGTECSCVTNVLSWGTCPTVIIGPSACGTDTTMLPSVKLWTPLGFLEQLYSISRSKWVQELLAYGSVPWVMQGLSPPGQLPGRWTLTLYDCAQQRSSLSLLQAQWWRWHARQARRLWAMVQFHK